MRLAGWLATETQWCRDRSDAQHCDSSAVCRAVECHRASTAQYARRCQQHSTELVAVPSQRTAGGDAPLNALPRRHTLLLACSLKALSPLRCLPVHQRRSAASLIAMSNSCTTAYTHTPLRSCRCDRCMAYHYSPLVAAPLSSLPALPACVAHSLPVAVSVCCVPALRCAACVAQVESRLRVCFAGQRTTQPHSNERLGVVQPQLAALLASPCPVLSCPVLSCPVLP